MSLPFDPLSFAGFAAEALPRAFGPAARLSRPELLAHGRSACAAIGARLLLACARERLLPSDLRDMVLRIGPFRLPLRRLGAFELHAPDLRDPDALPAPELLLRELFPARTPALARIAEELADSARNLALARAAADMREQTCSMGHPWPAPLDPENLVVDGHPWHPMCKTRLGLDPAENLQYGPDLLARAAVHAVDVAAAHAVVSGDLANLCRELFPAPPRGFIRLPVHALQLRRLPALLGPTRWGRIARPTDTPPLPARALLSLRTLALPAHSLHLKLSADIHTTSARRLVSPQSVHNGPLLSALLERVQSRDPFARRGLRIQPDLAAAGLHPDHGPAAAQLAVIARPDPADLAAELADESSHLPDQSFPMEPVRSALSPKILVCAALGERRPGGDLLLHELSADYPGGPRARLSAFFTDYLALLVPPLLRLWTAHGVALEAHLQNTLLVHDSRPCGFLVRDLGGVRVHRPRLAAAGETLDLAPGSFTITGELAEAQGKLMHTLVHAHLAALVGWIEDAGGPSHDELWPRVQRALDEPLRAWSVDPRLARACAEDRAFFFAPRCRMKALYTMRVDERVTDYAHSEVANALAAGYPPGAAA